MLHFQDQELELNPLQKWSEHGALKIQKKSITNLKNGENLRLNFCDSQPVAKHYVIGQKLGISGTPAIISQDGELYPGYFSPKDLLDKLKS